MTKSKVSILIPASNVEKYIAECMNSIINQSYTNWELIVVDDFSTDSTPQILKDFEQLDKRISVLKNTNKGIISALELAYSKSTGDLITRMDADDIMYPNKIEVLVNNLIQNGKGYLATGKVEYFAKKGVGEGYLKYQDWLNSLTDKGSNFTDIYKECVIPSPCWMAYREDFELCGGFNSKTYPEDYDLCFRFYKQGLKVIPCNDFIHKWRDYPNRTSRTDSNYSDNTFLELKCNYFLELDYDDKKELVIIGAGKKAKKVAQFLISNKIKINWLTNNENKIGHNIYGVILKDFLPQKLNNNSQVIVVVANPVERGNIKSSLNLTSKNQYYFC
jgi:glycosyltransferase involved in cell wall biosynthesis